MMVSEEDNGGGMDAVSYAVALEEISRGCAQLARIVVRPLYCAPVSANATSQQQKDEFLKPYASGEKIGCFALSEPVMGQMPAPRRQQRRTKATTPRAQRHEGLDHQCVRSRCGGGSRRPTKA